MSLTAWLTAGGIVIGFIWSIIKWRIVRGAKQAGKDEQELEQMKKQASDYRKINKMASKEDEAMHKRLNDDPGDFDPGSKPWVPDRSRKPRE